MVDVVISIGSCWLLGDTKPSSVSKRISDMLVDVNHKKTSKFRFTGFFRCGAKPLVTSGLSSRRASNAKSVSMWWRLDGQLSIFGNSRNFYYIWQHKQPNVHSPFPLINSINSLTMDGQSLPKSPVSFYRPHIDPVTNYRKVSYIRRTVYQNLNASRLIL